MKQKNNIFKEIIGEITRYLSSGAIGVLSDILILWILVEFTSIYLLIAVSIASILSTIINYIIQKIWAFRSSATFGKSFIKYTIVFAWNYFFTLGFMYMLVEVLGFHYMLIKILSFVFITVWNYFLYKHFVYA